MDFVRCTEVVRLSESPLLEISLYTFCHDCFNLPFYMQKFNVGKAKVSDLEFESSFSVTMQQDRECHVSLYSS